MVKTGCKHGVLRSENKGIFFTAFGENPTDNSLYSCKISIYAMLYICMGAKDIYCKQDIQPDCAGASVEENGNISNIRTRFIPAGIVLRHIISVVGILNKTCGKQWPLFFRGFTVSFFPSVCGKISIRTQQNFHQDAAKFSSGRSKTFFRTRQNFLQDAAKLSSGRGKTFFRTQQNFLQDATKFSRICKM